MAEDESCLMFHEMGLDDRLLKAIAKLRWSKPTPIQEKAIPLILEGKDVLARARTGSGKTGSFAVPLVQKLLVKKLNNVEPATRAIVLAPSKELCHQIYRNFVELTTSCSDTIRCADVSGQVDLVAQRPILVERPDIVVGTPARVLAHLQAGHIDLKTQLEVLVVDEADLVFSFGHSEDVHEILKYMPQLYQAILMSATLTPEVLNLKSVALRNAVILKLEEPAQHDQLSQYIIRCEEDDKFAVLCALFKLKLIRGKTLMFVSSVDRCYLVKLFLEQFGIRACILNSELPVSSRSFIVTQFNEGRYEILIASEEKRSLEDQVRGRRPKSSKRKQDKEYGVCRGIDFQFVSNVINIDFPSSVQSYIHRVGRTARGNNQGSALSFVKSKEEQLLLSVEQEMPLGALRPYQFKMEEIEGFRYRSKDALRAVTRIAIREARLKEIKAEMLTSEKLKSYFEENPREHKLLRHDKALHVIKHQPHLKNVPEYIVPPTLQRITSRKRRGQDDDDGDEVVAAGPCGNDFKMKKRKKRGFDGGKAKKQSNPLQSFKFEVD
ncbi:probable ATP-dependent RNA helicase DDX56 [Ornithodoros turicata]|uniref:probable ATP-dependent RNA helicase DDX56 n=1 Tax=Ornithodoros turicata TaxID=34597 RepID=UPI00313958A6